MNINPSDTLDRRARDLYRQSCEGLPAGSRHRLQKARLDAVATRPPALSRQLLMPAGALAASALALIVGWNYLPRESLSVPQPAAGASIQVPATARDGENMELYQDLDFYRWLAAQNEQALARN